MNEHNFTVKKEYGYGRRLLKKAVKKQINGMWSQNFQNWSVCDRIGWMHQVWNFWRGWSIFKFWWIKVFAFFCFFQERLLKSTSRKSFFTILDCCAFLGSRNLLFYETFQKKMERGLGILIRIFGWWSPAIDVSTLMLQCSTSAHS